MCLHCPSAAYSLLVRWQINCISILEWLLHSIFLILCIFTDGLCRIFQHFVLMWHCPALVCNACYITFCLYMWIFTTALHCTMLIICSACSAVTQLDALCKYMLVCMHVLKLLCNNHGEKRKYTKKYANCGEREKKLPQCLVRGFDSLPR